MTQAVGLLPNVEGATYHWLIVNPALKEQALQLEPAERIELITALTDSLEGYVPPEFAAVLQSRWAEIEADPNGYVTIDDDERELRARRSMA